MSLMLDKSGIKVASHSDRGSPIIEISDRDHPDIEISLDKFCEDVWFYLGSRSVPPYGIVPDEFDFMVKYVFTNTDLKPTNLPDPRSQLITLLFAHRKMFQKDKKDLVNWLIELEIVPGHNTPLGRKCERYAAPNEYV